MNGEIIPFTLTPTARAVRVYVGQMQRNAAMRRWHDQQKVAAYAMRRLQADASTTEKK